MGQPQFSTVEVMLVILVDNNFCQTFHLMVKLVGGGFQHVLFCLSLIRLRLVEAEGEGRLGDFGEGTRENEGAVATTPN